MTLRLLARMWPPADRAAAAHELAQHLGAKELLIFIRDPELGILLPAPGFPQTLPRGSAWPEFLNHCQQAPVTHGVLPLLSSGASALACGCRAEDGSVLVLLGVGELPEGADAVCTMLPLVASAFRGEQAEVTAAGHAAVAREVAAQARGLTETLDAARSELQRALREAQEADRRKDEFLSMLSHELRNPLAPIRNAVAILQARAADAVAVRNQGIIARQTQQLTRLVDDLLDISRINLGKIELRREIHPLAQPVQQAVEVSQPLITERQHTLTVTPAPETLWVEADCARLSQVISNLLTNAAKYTPRGGEIWLRLEHDEDTAVIRVRDSGRGIPRDMLPHVFDLFTQVDPLRDQSHGGLGIGLSLAKRLVEMHGGSITAQSEGPGCGSEFTVRLPLAAPAAFPMATGSPAATASAPGGRRILIVDDNRDAAETLGDLLEIHGHQCRVCYGGPEALEVVPAYRPDVIFLDLSMPGMDGCEVAAQLRHALGFRGRLVALTGYGQEQDRRRTRQAGFDAHVTKPIDPDALAALVESKAPSS